MGNKIKFGLERVHIAFRDAEGWETPVHIPGAVNLSMSPDGGETAFYADNKKYYSRFTNNGYTGTLELALVPKALLAEMLGWEIDSNGALVEVTDGQPKAFALLGQVLGDERNRRFVYYNCTASRPADNAQTTTENAEPQTETLNITILPFDHEDKPIVKTTIERCEANEAVYNGWFNAVVLPDGEPVAVDKTVLTATIDLAGTLDELDYTPESWTAFSTALTAAEGVAADTEAAQSTVNQAITALQAAILGLEAAGE